MQRKLKAILSSAAPFNGSAYDDLQRQAIRSWREVADSTILFNNPEDIGEASMCIEPRENPPCVHQMLTAAYKLFKEEDVIALVNSDIVLTPETSRILQVAERQHLGRGWACTSFRWEDGQVRGQGLDFFAMTMPVVVQVLRDCPRFMTVGRTLWDNWLNGWLRCHLPSQRFFNITDWKCVHHPLHDRIPNRLSNYTEEQVKEIFASGDLDCRGIPDTKYAIP